MASPSSSAVPTTQPEIRVVHIDDSADLRRAWQRLLDSVPDITLVGSASDTPSGAHLVFETQPRVVLLDLDLPGGDPLELVTQISRTQPNTRVLIYSGHDDPQHVDLARNAGASGIIGKHEHPSRVIDAIRAVASGNVLFP